MESTGHGKTKAENPDPFRSATGPPPGFRQVSAGPLGDSGQQQWSPPAISRHKAGEAGAPYGRKTPTTQLQGGQGQQVSANRMDFDVIHSSFCNLHSPFFILHSS